MVTNPNDPLIDTGISMGVSTIVGCGLGGWPRGLLELVAWQLIGNEHMRCSAPVNEWRNQPSVYSSFIRCFVHPTTRRGFTSYLLRSNAINSWLSEK
jgi:hypothetical protein